MITRLALAVLLRALLVSAGSETVVSRRECGSDSSCRAISKDPSIIANLPPASILPLPLKSLQDEPIISLASLRIRNAQEEEEHTEDDGHDHSAEEEAQMEQHATAEEDGHDHSDEDDEHADEETHTEDDGHDHSAEDSTPTAAAAQAAATTKAAEHCHFHAGVEHCESDEEESSASELQCGKRDRDYNIPFRIGAVFIVLFTSAIAVFLPIFLQRFGRSRGYSLVFLVIKQFGTGVIIATSFVHLLTHAQLLFSNECVGTLAYEPTVSAIAMAGIIAAFMVEYLGNRFIAARQERQSAPDQEAVVTEKSETTHVNEGDNSSDGGASEGRTSPHSMSICGHGGAVPDDKLSVLVMELGIIFHSILIGITLVVAGDSVFSTLLVVIIFHQAFEGLALGARISTLSPVSSMSSTKMMLGGLFALITPIGMAIGIGVRQQFNGSDKGTLIALGTLDAFSAGILVWVGVVEMLAHDWLYGELKYASIRRTLIGGLSLACGMVLMSLLGKWT